MSVKDDRVDLVVADCSGAPGPDQRLVWEIATRLPRARFAVEVWLPSETSRDPLADALLERDIAVERLARLASGARLWRAWFGAWRKLRRRRPALVHLHRPLGARSRWAMALSELCPAARVVISEHSIGAPSSAPARLIERRLAERADALLAPDAPTADRWVRDLGVSRDRVRTLLDGVDFPDEDAEAEPARNLRRALGAGVFKPLWLCTAPLEAGRGHETLLAALARCRDAGIPFMAAWSSDGPHRAELERHASALGLGDRVRFGVREASLGISITAADLVVHPAPRPDDADALLQAMARERPIVAGTSGPAAESIENGVHGWLVPLDDPNELAAALEAMTRHGDAARRMAAAAWTRTREERSWARIVDELEAVYDDVLGYATFVPHAAPVAARR